MEQFLETENFCVLSIKQYNKNLNRFLKEPVFSDFITGKEKTVHFQRPHIPTSVTHWHSSNCSVIWVVVFGYADDTLVISPACVVLGAWSDELGD